MEDKITRFTVVMPEDIYKKLKITCVTEERSMREVIVELIESYLESKLV